MPTSEHVSEHAETLGDTAAASGISSSYNAIAVEDLRAEAEQVAAEVVRRGLASEADLAPHRPGGDKNRDAGPRGWLRFFAVAHRFHARGESAGGGAATSSATAEADALVMKAFTREPVLVRLYTDPDRLIFAHPKGLEAQAHLHALDMRIAWEASQIAWLKELATPAAMDVLPMALDTLAYTTQLVAWIITTEGPELPYAVTDPAPVVPEHIRRLEAVDYLQLNRAWRSLAQRQQALTALVDARAADAGGARMSWSQFIALQAPSVGGNTLILTRHRTLDELIAAVRLEADAKAPRNQGEAS